MTGREIHNQEREFGVDIFHLPQLPGQRDDFHLGHYEGIAVDTVMKIHSEEPPGDILLFLTGRAEIERVCEELKKRVDYMHTQREGGYHKKELLDMAIQPIYGALAPEEQLAVFAEVLLLLLLFRAKRGRKGY